METFQYIAGNSPVLISMPHNGVLIPPEIQSKMTDSALQVVDTDWHLDKLYSFARELECNMIIPYYSRYVVDLNRPEDNQSLYPGADTTGLCPLTQFNQEAIYKKGCEPDAEEIERRIELFWRPYHSQLSNALNQIKAQFGYAFLFEAHSIKSVVPRFFEGTLKDFNFGNFAEKSSSEVVTNFIKQWQPEGYSKVVNGRFKGGYITRHYGSPSEGIDSLQLELSQATYMNEVELHYNEEKAKQVIPVLKDLIKCLQNLN